MEKLFLLECFYLPVKVKIQVLNSLRQYCIWYDFSVSVQIHLIDSCLYRDDCILYSFISHMNVKVLVLELNWF